MRGQVLGALLAILVLASGAQGQKYTITLRRAPDVGKSVVVKDSEGKTVVVKLYDDTGNLLNNEKHTEKNEEVYTETILEKGEKSPRKYRRTYEKATRTRDDATQVRSYQGRTLVFTQKDGKYAVAAQGDKPLDREDLAELTRKANDRDEAQEQVFLPKKPVAAGDSWKIDTAELVKAFSKNGKLDPKRTSAEARLTRAYRKDGRQFGTIAMTLRLALGEAPRGVTFEKPPVVEMKITLDTAIDGSSTAGKMTMTGKTTSKASVEQKGKKLVIESQVDLSGTKEQSREE